MDRRGFLRRFFAGLGGLFCAPFIHRSPLSGLSAQSVAVSSPEKRVLLRDGLIIDGTGSPGYNGSVLIENDRIRDVGNIPDITGAEVIDCSGKVISPGFIDMHSHMDWVLPLAGHEEMKAPYLEQGITTFVAGNCGYGVAGFRENTGFLPLIEQRIMGMYHIEWRRMEEYFDFLEKRGLSHNLVNLAGHGTSRASIKGYDASALTQSEEKELLNLLHQAMSEGAAGVSFGLQYEPGIFASQQEIEKIAHLAKEQNKPITVHGRAYSSVSGTYKLKLFGTPHNLLAVQDMIDIAKKTGVRLQYSHLIFVGKLTWRNYERTLRTIEKARDEGLDISFDTYPYHCGVSHINVFFPDWFLAHVPEAYENSSLLNKLKLQITFMEKVLGFGYAQIQITHAIHPELEEFNGMFLDEIARKRKMSNFENFIDIARKSKGVARVLNHRYSNEEIVRELLKHPASLYMTDATTVQMGVQNPGCYGAFPLILQRIRDEKIIPLEEAIYKMTGASADRFQIKDRGRISKNLMADITVFDFAGIKDNNTIVETDKKPDGIEHVFVNGKQVVKNGKAISPLTAGRVIRI